MTGRHSLITGKRSIIIGTVLVILIIVLGISLAFSLRSAPSLGQSDETQTAVETMNREELETEKLRQEVTQLQIEIDQLRSPWQDISSYATLITAMVAVAGVFVTIWKQFSERQRDREQREVDSRRRLDEKFSSIVKDMSSDNLSLQISATISLMTFLRDEYKEFHEQVYLILLANLKLKHNLQVDRLLIQVFERAIHLKVEAMHDLGDSQGLDLTDTNLYRIDLSGLDLSNSDLAFANLELANFDGTNLFRVKGYEANFVKAKFTDANLNEVRFAKANLEGAHLHKANLVASNLKETNLKGGQFFQAKLQSAHLEGADLTNARFEQADLNDTYFLGAKINPPALNSIFKAYHWESAHFDEDVMLKLRELRQNSQA